MLEQSPCSPGYFKWLTQNATIRLEEYLLFCWLWKESFLCLKGHYGYVLPYDSL